MDIHRDADALRCLLEPRGAENSTNPGPMCAGGVRICDFSSRDSVCGELFPPPSAVHGAVTIHTHVSVTPLG